jgi:LPXTG-site transpeptidase (sortase) family protein
MYTKSMHVYKRPRVIIAFSALLLAMAGGATYVAHRPHKQTQPPGITHVISATTDTPSEAPLTKDTYASTAAPNEPKYINLPSIQAGGFIQKMGIDQNMQIAAPSNVNLAGWYVNSAIPGQAGLSIIDGHVDGLASPGIFKRLSQLKADDQFVIELGNGTKLNYSVMSVALVANDKAVGTLFSQEPEVHSQLNLITCGGTFNRTSKNYEQRVIVAAKLLPTPSTE